MNDYFVHQHSEKVVLGGFFDTERPPFGETLRGNRKTHERQEMWNELPALLCATLFVVRVRSNTDKTKNFTFYNIFKEILILINNLKRNTRGPTFKKMHLMQTKH